MDGTNKKAENKNKAVSFKLGKDQAKIRNIFNALKDEIGVKKAEQMIQQAILEKEAELSEMPTNAQPGNNKQIKIAEYKKELDHITPFEITHDAFKKNIRETVLGPQSARNLLNYVENNHKQAVKYIKDNSQFAEYEGFGYTPAGTDGYLIKLASTQTVPVVNPNVNTITIFIFNRIKINDMLNNIKKYVENFFYNLCYRLITIL